MRLTRPAGRFPKAAGFYNYEMSFVGLLLAGPSFILMPFLVRAEWKGWAVGGRCLFILGLVLMVVDELQYRRLMRLLRELSKKSSDKETGD
ncbi:hypothetical protein BGE01nite_40940 [Brevifollis gellanilyticus]|uniref:Uncharacterized protein n=1 Tax=Brevifollis gellanilyticus TaxID=748831 RepID=A0A512MDJ1_9BACT|nr:hypothetical protein BGE01nite_40940 [Brevifollis gellanilyticus]